MGWAVVMGWATCAQPRAAGSSRVVRCSASVQQAERDIHFNPGLSFYRPQSVFSRDLACLSAQLLRAERGGRLSVLDLMAGAGVRGMRYLQHSQADLVWCNDLSPNTHCVLADNLAAALAAAQAAAAVAGNGAPPSSAQPPAGPVEVELPLLDRPALDWRLGGLGGGLAGEEGDPAVRLTREEASRLLHWCSLSRKFFDFIDIDSFGGDSAFIGSALGALRFGGLLCLTSTAGPVAGGRDPVSALSQYGTFLAPVPYANEQGLRMLLGMACREALARGLALTPLWSLYSPHGPVFRVMVRVGRAGGREEVMQQQRQYGFLLHDPASGDSQVVAWDGLAAAGAAAATAGDRPSPAAGEDPRPTMSGPLWVGPLQDREHLAQLLALAEARGWADRESCAGSLPWTKKGGVRSFGELLALLLGESDPRLPPWHFFVNTDVARRGRLQRPPRRDELVAALQSRGYAACATHLDSKALRTNAQLAAIVSTCVEDLGIPTASSLGS